MNYKIVTKYIKVQLLKSQTKIYFNLANDINNYRINIDIKSEQLKDKLIFSKHNTFTNTKGKF